MKVILSIILFPILWTLEFIWRVLIIDIILGLLQFLYYLFTLQILDSLLSLILTIVDILIGAIITLINTINLSLDIARGNVGILDAFSIATIGQKRRKVKKNSIKAEVNEL